MRDFFEGYNNYLINNYKKNTALSYMRDLMNFVKETDIKTVSDISEITEKSIQDYMLLLKSRGMSYSSLARNAASLRRFFAYCASLGFLDKEPTVDAQIPQRQRKLPDTVTVSDVVKILEAPDTSNVKGMRDKAMLELMYATGAKVSEIINLKINDVNLKNEIAILSAGNKQRFVPLGKNAVQSTFLYLKEGRVKIPSADKSDILFLNFHGEMLTRQGFWKIIKHYIELAGISGNVTAQTLRHSFALHLLANGADVNSVTEMMGYSDPSSTKIYLDVMNSKIKDVYKKAHPRA